MRCNPFLKFLHCKSELCYINFITIFYRGCISVMGCQWCQVHKDMNPISTPYCADQRVCFGGIEEAPTPYGDEVRGK